LKVRKYKIFKMKNLFIGLMLLTASFSFANSEVVVKNVEVILPVTTVVVAKTEVNKPSTDDKRICVCQGNNCGCGTTLDEAERALALSTQP
jgi:hypothetical protein